MDKIIITTKEELEEAKNNEIKTIIVKGELADKLHKSKQITNLGKVGLGILIAAVGLAPVTGGLSLSAGIVSAATLTGIDVAIIIIAASIGISLIIAVFKEYDEISYKNGEHELILRRKRK